MTAPPDRPKIYHITHVDNLDGIVANGGLLSDRNVLATGAATQPIGMSGIKKRRLEELAVDRHPGTMVGDYVPFYFCPRSIMLFVLHCANHSELTYRGGQDPIVHLEADLYSVIEWAGQNGRPWAFSLSNAGAYYVEFRSSVDELDQLNWSAIAERDFRDPNVKEGKQAEFLLYGGFPFDLVERIGVRLPVVQASAAAGIKAANHQPTLQIRPDWYF